MEHLTEILTYLLQRQENGEFSAEKEEIRKKALSPQKRNRKGEQETMKNVLKEKLANGGKPIGTFFELGSPSVVEALGRTGLDFVILDNEHGPFEAESTRDNLLNMLQCARRFALGNQERFVVPVFHLPGYALCRGFVKAPAVLAGRAETTLADGRIFRIGNQFFYLLHTVYIGDNQSLCADVQQFQHSRTAAFAHARQRAEPAVFCRADKIPRAFRWRTGAY